MRTKIENQWSCDFETTTDPADARVWAWVAINIADTEKRFYGNSIESFIEWCSTRSKTLYFHNLKFDGSYIIDHLLRTDWTVSETLKGMEEHQFNTLISDKGFFYTMQLKFHKANVRIIDSLKIINSSVDRIAKGWKLPVSKLSIDYHEYRAPGHVLTKEEKEYITNDALIVAIALKSILDQGFTKITAGSNAFNYYVENCCGGKSNFRKVFPVPENDAYVRKSYRGGFSFANPRFTNKLLGEGRVYDVNSLYPAALHSPNVYPYGEPVYYSGEYQPNDEYPLFVCHIIADFHLKKDHLPMLQLKHNPSYIPTQYITETKGSVDLYLTSVDYRLFLDQYDIDYLQFVDGYMYKGRAGMFDSYIDHWYQVKADSKHEGNMAMYQLAKLMLNSFYGKLATNPEVCSRWPYLDKDKNIVCYRPGEYEQKEPVYIAAGTFCTAYARNITIRAAQSCYDRFLYADTDSLHILGDFDVPGLPVDNYKLGYFKHESTFTEAKYIRAKLYMEKIDGKWDVKGAGMTPEIKKQVTPENFHVDTVYTGKLKQRTVPGGIVLLETTHHIRG